MKIAPIADQILVRRLEEQEKTSGGIIIPDTAKETPQEARVIAVGLGQKLKNGDVRPLDVKPGDRVLIGQYAGSEVMLDGEDHLILRESDVLGVIG